MKSSRRTIDIALSIAGTAVVFSGVLFFVDLRVQMALVLLGLLLIEAGIWKLSHPLMPEGRCYHALRAETDRFIGLVRRLNSASLQAGESTVDGRDRFERTLTAMHASVDRMAALAGKTDDVLAADPVPDLRDAGAL